jgi:outer membrane immunogenic protein
MEFMRRLSVTFIAAVSTIALTQVASAADMPVKAPITKAPIVAPRYDWSGIYVGGHIGYLWGRTRVEEDGVVTEPGAKTDGVIGGVLAGYNWQNGPVVLGIEGDFGWTHAQGSGEFTLVTTQAPNTYDLNWTSHLRGRAGYAVNSWLFYVAGGLAVADLDFHEGAITITRIPFPTEGGKYFGWSIGGGVEYVFTRNLVGRIEYLYDDYGHKDYIGVTGDPYRVSLTGQTVRGALAWKFNPSGM